jgi:hypothetical protein
MTHPEIKDRQETRGSGYDAARSARDEDHLNRWPFAQEIYRIASSGPRDWSVRIGVYGEWGSGKTSVINFVNSMAREDGHVIFTFNPWQFQTTEELWKAFVEGLYARIEDATQTKAPEARSRQVKAAAGTAAKILPKIFGLWKSEAADALNGGIGLLRKYLVFNADDLAKLRDVLGERRLIVAIDDLDRTDAKLVPEVLFALKEIMDVPGMAFICAFDPMIVGRVLGSSHAGFGDGLNFLEKIIDYPRWLPESTNEQLAKLAVADATKFCPYVPATELTEMVRLLPKNPRAIRQFIRILDLLRHQIQRHHPYEIQWSILLAANVLKVRFPKISHDILGDSQFWEDIYESTLFGEKNKDDLRTLITTKVDAILRNGSGAPDPATDELVNCVAAIAGKLNAWHGLGLEGLRYQFHLAESPCAVTWKEFDSLLEHLDSSSITLESARDWIEIHSLNGGQSKTQVFTEVLTAAISRRLAYLSKAADAMPGKEMNEGLKSASKILRLIEVLMTEMPRLDSRDYLPDATQISAMFEQVRQYFHWRRTPAYRAARREEEKILKKLFMTTPDAIEPWIEIVGLRDGYGRHEENGTEWRALISIFRKTLQDRCSRWLIQQFPTRSEFLRNVIREEKHGYLYRELFLDLSGPVWHKYRKELLVKLRPKSGNATLQNNAYDLLSWLESSITDDRGNSKNARAVLGQNDFALALWKACVSEPLNPRAVGSLRDAHDLLMSLGFGCKTPAWWDLIVKDLPPSKNP